MQTSDREEVKRAGLLKWFLDVFGCLMSEAQHNPAEKILHLRRVLQPSANYALHPCARLLRPAYNGVAAAVPNRCAILRIANKEHSTNVVTRQIRAHIKFAGISRRRDHFRDSKKL